jgi:FixJ family two-component response regulator
MEARKIRLLIVDDEEVTREVLRFSLSPPNRTDIALMEASSSSEALALIGAEDYDLVLLDMRLPLSTEGLDVLVEIKRLKPQITVIMISAWGDIPKTVEAMRRGAKDFIPKEPGFERIVALKLDDFIRTTRLVADRERLIQAKYHELLRAKSARKKGRALEDLLAALFASIEGFIEIGRNVNTATEEIDLVFRNGSQAPNWQRQSEIILVECKNWQSQRVGKNEFVVFKAKMQTRAGRCELGFLVCTERFAETVEKEMLRSSQTRLLVVPIDGEDLRQLVEGQERGSILLDFVNRSLLT